MTLAVFLLLGALALYFGGEAAMQKQRADRFERLYLNEKDNLDKVLEGLEEFAHDGTVPVQEGLVRVWRQSREVAR